MTDTSRTVADLKARLDGTGSSHEVGRPIVRDLIESVANPVPGGFGPVLGHDEAALTVVRKANEPNPIVLHPGELRIVPLRVIKDPAGWVVPGAYTTPSYDIPANSSWVLPPGIYTMSTDFLFTIAGNTNFKCSFEWTDWTVVNAVNDSVYAGDAFFYFPAHGSRGDGHPETIGIYRQTQAMHDGGQGVCILAGNYDATQDMVFNYCDIFIVRLL